jgi:hypothetical protein
MPRSSATSVDPVTDESACRRRDKRSLIQDAAIKVARTVVDIFMHGMAAEAPVP